MSQPQGMMVTQSDPYATTLPPLEVPMRDELTAVTEHGRKRLRQRAISSEVISHVLEYGVQVRSFGTTRVFLDRRGRERLTRREGSELVRRDRHKLDVFLVLDDDGCLVTAGYRTGRMRRR